MGDDDVFNSMIKYQLIHLIHKALDGIYLLVIPVAFLIVMRRVVMEEVRYVLGALSSRMNRARRPQGGDRTTSLNDLVIRLDASDDQQQRGTAAPDAGDV